MGSLEDELFDAVKSGDLLRVEELLKKGADPNAKDNNGMTPLHWAAFEGHVDVVRLLLERGADVNAKDNNGWTPLHEAAYSGYVNVVKLLLESGADPGARDRDGRTPLDVARERGRKKVASLLEKYSRLRGEKPGATVRPPFRLVEGASLSSVEAVGVGTYSWGKLVVRIQGRGVVKVSVEGDVDCLLPGPIRVEGEQVVEVPVKARAPGKIPVKVTVSGGGSEDWRIVWVEAHRQVCPSCGAPVEPGARYCWRCGVKLQ